MKKQTERVLSDFSKEGKTWKQKKSENSQLRRIFSKSDSHILEKQAERLHKCCSVLEFSVVDGNGFDLTTGEIDNAKLKLTYASHCCVRLCPVCQSRRQFFNQARFVKAIPKIEVQHPTARYIFLTLTVKNPSIYDLRETLNNMNAAWQRLIQRKQFKSLVLGWVRSTEITNKHNDMTCHPHFHAILMVKPSYFDGRSYITKAKWAELWRDALRANYTPIVDIRCLKPKRKTEKVASIPMSAVLETFKYAIKSKDLLTNDKWTQELALQIHKCRFLASGGVFKDILKEESKITNEDLLFLDSELKNDVVLASLLFLWNGQDYLYKRYKITNKEDEKNSPEVVDIKDFIQKIVMESSRDLEKKAKNSDYVLPKIKDGEV